MPFAGFKDFGECVSAQMKDGKSEESANKICGALQAQSEKKESIEESNRQWYTVKGTALTKGTSRNGNTYTENDLKANHGKNVKLFVGDEHIGNVDNVVGNVTFNYDGDKLTYEGRFRDTDRHTDIVSKAEDGLLNTSIGAIKPGENDPIDIRHLALVGTPGVPDASVDLVMAESFEVGNVIEENDKDIKTIKSDVIEASTNKPEVNNMSEEKNDALLKENEELKKQVESMKLAQKKTIVESVLALNKDLKESELMEKSDEELKLIESYEKKLKESEEEKKEEEPKEEEEKKAEGEGESAVGEEPKPAEESTNDGYDIVESKNEITLSKESYNKFRDDIRKIYE